MKTKRFTIVNEGFRCDHCGREVAPTSITTPRNHCPFCLWSKHVDVNPGDRANPCRGPMEPVGVVVETRRIYVIVHQCVRCGKHALSKAILKSHQSDDGELILQLSTRPIKTQSMW